MAYGTSALVKEVLHQPSAADAEIDPEITNRIEAADAWIDGELAKVGLSVPLGTVPTLIKHASTYLAADMFRAHRDIPGVPRTFQEIAMAMLKSYIQSVREYSAVGAIRPKGLDRSV